VKRLGVLALVGAFVLCGQAQAVQLVNPDGTPSRYQRWANRLPVPTLRARITVSPDMSLCEGNGACALGDTIYYNGQVDIAALAHELGHTFDAHVLSDVDRSRLEALMGYTAGTPWFGCEYVAQPGCIDYSESPQETFANSYANCTNRDGSGDVYTGPGGGDVIERDKRALCRTIDAIAWAQPGGVDWTACSDPPTVLAGHAQRRHARQRHRHARRLSR
jgi:hypothetical protein